MPPSKFTIAAEIPHRRLDGEFSITGSNELEMYPFIVTLALSCGLDNTTYLCQVQGPFPSQLSLISIHSAAVPRRIIPFEERHEPKVTFFEVVEVGGDWNVLHDLEH